jgi:glycosyltransferase involved in cell wall biosynthesis
VRAEGEFLKDLRPEVRLINLDKKRTLTAIPSLAKYLRTERPVVLMSRMNYVNIVAGLAWILARRPCRLVLTEANVVKSPGGSWCNRFRQKLMLNAMRAIYSRSDCVVANSDGTARSMKLNGLFSRGGIITLANPVLPTKKNPTEDCQVPLELTRRGRNFICAIGRLSEQKGFDSLLSAFAKIYNKEIELVILGEGPLRGSLEAQIKKLGIQERVHLPGFINNPLDVLNQASLFVLSSRWEGFGNVIVEALASGVPVVSTDCPGAPRELLCNGALGHLVQVDDPGALATAITEALHSPRGTPEARRLRASNFAAPLIARQYLEKAFGLQIH